MPLMALLPILVIMQEVPLTIYSHSKAMLLLQSVQLLLEAGAWMATPRYACKQA